MYLSERYLKARYNWCDLASAASMLEGTKSAVFSQMVMKRVNEGLSVAKSELLTRASDEWVTHVKAINEARDKANRAWSEVEYLKMLGWEEASKAADNRIQAKL